MSFEKVERRYKRIGMIRGLDRGKLFQLVEGSRARGQRFKVKGKRIGGDNEKKHFYMASCEVDPLSNKVAAFKRDLDLYLKEKSIARRQEKGRGEGLELFISQ